MNTLPRIAASPLPAADRAGVVAAIRRASLAEIGYVVFLLLIFVGVAPFASADASSGGDAAAVAGAGDAMRQVSYLLAFALILCAAIGDRRAALVRAVPPVFAVLLAWCLISCAWAPDPAVSLRRAVLLCIVCSSVFVSVQSLGTARSLELLCYVLAAVVVIDFASVILVPAARHLSDDIEPNVVGDWRGVHGHKNVAGALYVDAILIFSYWAIVERKRFAIPLALAGAVFLVGTNSKSSIGLLPLAGAGGVIFLLSNRNMANRRIVVVTAALIAAVAFAIVAAWWAPIVQAFNDPELFTGRTAIWQAEWAYILDHPWLGSGFGSFAYTGKTSPIYDYISNAWTGAVANGHQGYLELLVTTGVPGFVLAMASFLYEPVAQLSGSGTIPRPLRALFCALFVFFFLHNFMESDFLKTDTAEWVMFVAVLAMLRQPASAQRARERIGGIAPGGSKDVRGSRPV
jgi:O-antigen ligase